MGPKINLFNSNWVDTVFEGRNQDYGAYVLRKENGKTSFIAFILGAIFFSLLIASPVISKSLFGGSQKEVKEALTEKTVLADILLEQQPEPIQEVIVEKQVKSLVEVVKHVPPVIVEKEEVEVEMKSVDDFKDKITGADNVDASDDGQIALDAKPAEVEVDSKVIDANHVFTIVEVKPDYPGGIAEFYKYVKNNFRVPDDLSSNGMVIVNFIVEVDGSLTDIKVVRDMGYGTGKEAIRILKNAKKWNPGVQNGRNVRVLYTLPIRINTQ